MEMFFYIISILTILIIIPIAICISLWILVDKTELRSEMVRPISGLIITLYVCALIVNLILLIQSILIFSPIDGGCKPSQSFDILLITIDGLLLSVHIGIIIHFVYKKVMHNRGEGWGESGD